jgi:hypothetical protein
MLARHGNESGAARRPALMTLDMLGKSSLTFRLLRGDTNFAHRDCTRDVPSVSK